MKTVLAQRASAILYFLLKSWRDERPWLLPANICPIVPITFLKANVPFEFVDISTGTLHMDLEQSWALIQTCRFGGVLYSHTYGEESTPDEFFRKIKEFDETIRVVDDLCLCVPSLQPNKNVFVDVQLFSTGYAKIVDLGFGGYAFLNDNVEYRTFLLSFDARASDQIEDEYKSAVRDRLVFTYKDVDWLETKPLPLPWQDYSRQIKAGLDKTIIQRTRLNKIYKSLLPLELQLPAEYQTWRFNIRLKDKVGALKKIFEAGLYASSHYASLAGIIAPGRCPSAELLHDSIINLFNDHHFDESRAEQVCNILSVHIS